MALASDDGPFVVIGTGMEGSDVHYATVVPDVATGVAVGEQWLSWAWHNMLHYFPPVKIRRRHDPRVEDNAAWAEVGDEHRCGPYRYHLIKLSEKPPRDTTSEAVTTQEESG